MSRHEFTKDDLAIVVGWDPPLSTYFAQVWPKELEPSQDVHEDYPSLDYADPLLWVGTSPHELPTVEMLAERLKPYAAIPTELAETLRAEREQSPGVTWPDDVQQYGSKHFLEEAINRLKEEPGKSKEPRQSQEQESDQDHEPEISR